MSQLVVLKLGQGDWQQGFHTVTLQLWQTAPPQIPTQWAGSLTPNAQLPELCDRWRTLYMALSKRMTWRRLSRRSSIDIEDEGITNVSVTDFDLVCQQLKQEIDRWLDSSTFSKAERRLRTRLLPTEEIRVIIETDDPYLRRLPWHLWSFFEDYPQAEVALSAPEYGKAVLTHRTPDRVRILAILGNSEGIDIQHDRTLLENLPATETVFLVEPQRQDLDRWLWDEQGWNILFFAGHSTSHADGETGEMMINGSDTVTIAHLKNALKAAIGRGLSLAIFNSCDGLGLARAMADLNIPQLVVMREPVPDRVAQVFVTDLLTTFANGKSFYQSVRQAREKLQGLEDEFPCASWLPVICQNPAETPISWSTLKEAQPTTPSLSTHVNKFRRTSVKMGLMLSLAITSLVLGIRALGGLEQSELALFDRLLRSRPGEGTDPRILVVEVTQDDTNQYGYPLEDKTLAQLIEKLETARPRAIGLDMHRYQSRGQGRSQFIQQFTNPNLYLVCSFGSNDRNSAPPPEFSEAQRTTQMGFSDLLLDSGDTQTVTRTDTVSSEQAIHPEDQVRRQILSYEPGLTDTPTSCTTPYSLNLQLAYRYLAATGIPPAVTPDGNWQFGSVVLQKLPSRFGAYQRLDGRMSQILINYRTDPPGQRVTLQQVLQGQVSASWIRDRIILIGTSAPVARDSFNTPYGDMPGIWIHAHQISQILSAVSQKRPFISGLPQWRDIQWGDGLWILGWAAIAGWTTVRLRLLWLTAIATGVMVLMLYYLSLWFLVQGIWLPLLPSVLAVLLTSTAVIIYSAVVNSFTRSNHGGF
ncbi:MAG: CHASE2 domain-containing protein [Drouetiella hepatica Uher 2000/2452]|jgi:CHASE2 domain-containing sensor protein|uniref:CHASE2 domain-containing protein n=1 Tax=Drouetiella hepatica Uher 2000/2452 TaxID=904376 RepID=A0A951QH27_9CYAN|nr:CHASE2 domain-containing protein [Drouetiella hepatica Uher 2000/2452]